MDAGFGISYNSLIWIKSASTSEMIYNPDSSNVGPGFKFGYSTIEYPYYDSNAGAYAFIMVGADGSRTEFRQIGGGDDFEPGDSSYRLLRVGPGTKLDGKAADIDITVYSTDGTQFHYLWKSGHYRLEEIKDRNGNYIMMDYSSTGGRLTKVTDTLGREINIAYDTGGYPTEITQTWKTNNGAGSGTTTHYWAKFYYSNVTVSHNFGSLTVTGPANSTTVKTLEKIEYADGSATKFEYNGYVQVKKITNIAADTTTNLNYVETNLADVTGTQSDVPRLTETRSWAKDFNVISGTATPVVVKNTLSASQTYNLGDATGTATRIQVYVEGHPNDLRSNTFVNASGWNEGLPIGTEDCITTSSTCTTQKRWTWNEWTQDNTSVSYITNPRITESKVGDSGSTRRTEIDYGTNGYGLPVKIEVFDDETDILYKKTETEYNLSSTYTDKRIIGLTSKVESWGRNDLTSSLEQVSKVTYAYDEGDFSGSGQTISPTRQATGYGSTYIAGRGNLTTVKRWDMAYPTTESASTVSTMKYNTAGSVVSKTTPWYSTYTRTVSISYTDNFNSTVSPATYAYPTTVTDPNSQSSTVKYRFDIGANVEATSPAPAGQTYGKTSKRLYDSYGRLERDSVYVNTTEKFYTRYEFPTSGTHSKVFSTITDVPGSIAGPDADDEVLSESFTDGAGRVIKSRSPHTFNTNGTTATWSGVKVEYDLLGRVKKQSVPTEVDSNFDLAGDDVARGWLYTYQKYDWKNRVIRKIATDGADSSTLNDSDILISYEGCGCAGGQVTTIESERVPYGTSSYARRKQKVYEDILGRSWKSESYDWDGTTVYSTQTQKYNGRDQVLRSRQYSGTDSSSTYQDYTASFDGFGRLYQSHKPEQHDNSNAPTYTTYTYNLDDSISTVMDARGATTNFTYNTRGLVTNIAWDVGSTGITDPTDVTFSYDNLGNRTQMTDGLGQVDYEYDSLSRMTAETRDFTDELYYSPIYGGKYKFEYTYDLTGLKSYKEPFGETVTYTNDKAGRLSQVAGAWSGGSQTYANNPHYRAWGALQNLDYGNGTEMNVTAFNNRLQATEFEVKKDSTSIISKDYEFYADGQMKTSTDNTNAKFDRTFKYDHQARVTNVLSGAEARGSTDTAANIPFGNTLGYNAFDNQTSAGNKHFTNVNGGGFTHTYVNNRISELGNINYDVDGNQLRSADNVYKTYSYNAAGQMSSTYYQHMINGNTTLAYENFETISYSGDGQVVKIATVHDPVEGDNETDGSFQIRSTVLGGQTITTTDSTGGKLESAIVAAGSTVAKAFSDNSAIWTHFDPNSDSVRSTNSSGTVVDYDNDFGKLELDGSGRNVGLTNPYSGDPQWDNIPNLYQAQQSYSSMINGMPATYKVDGFEVPQSVYDERKQSLIGNEFAFLEYIAALSSKITIEDNGRPIGTYKDRRSIPEHLLYHLRAGRLSASWTHSGWELFNADFKKARLTELGEFLNANKNCATLLYNLAAEKIGVIDPSDRDNPTEIFLESLNVIDATSNNPAVSGQPLYEGSDMTLAQAKVNTLADGDSELNRVRVYDRYFTSTSPSRGFVFFHELLHVLLNTGVRGSHIELAKNLGLDFTETPLRETSTPFAAPSVMAIAQMRERDKLREKDDERAFDVVNDFIGRNCTK